MPRRASYGRLSEKVSEDLVAKVTSGRYRVGQRLPSQRTLSQIYSVSRPTIRQALIALEFDGMVEVRKGSGVYVTSPIPQSGEPAETEVGAFELLEAHRAIEGEVCALAAVRISEEELDELASLLEELKDAGGDIAGWEDADRRFHAVIARATQNSPMVDAVEALWDAHSLSPQYQLLSDKVHATEVLRHIEEYAQIFEALGTNDSGRARAAMRAHLTRFLESVLKIIEVQEIEQACERVAQQRKRYSSGEAIDWTTQ